MCAIQGIVIIVNGKGGRRPTRSGRMAHIAIRWNSQCYVVGIATAVVIGQMASFTGVGGIAVITADVTSCTIIGNRYMRSREGEIRIVIETGGSPGRLGMAGGTIRRELIGCVIRVRCGVEICCVAANTGIGRIVVIAVVAGRTIIRYCSMCAIQGIIIVVNGKGGRRPARVGRMAARTICGET